MNSLPAAPPVNVSMDATIPVLHDPISIAEVEFQVKSKKVDKACGPEGLISGVFSLLPAQWLLTIASLFSMVFMSGMCPVSWLRVWVII